MNPPQQRHRPYSQHEVLYKQQTGLPVETKEVDMRHNSGHDAYFGEDTVHKQRTV